MKTCRFCLANNLLHDAPIYENAAFFVLAMLEEMREKAVMIVVKRHVETPFDIAPDEWGHLTDALTFAKTRLSAFQPTGYSVGWNVGADGGQHVMHAHLHVICRFGNEPATGAGIGGLIRRANAAG